MTKNACFNDKPEMRLRFEFVQKKSDPQWVIFFNEIFYLYLIDPGCPLIDSIDFVALEEA